MAHNLFKGQHILVCKIMHELKYLCGKYDIPLHDVVKIGNTHDLIEFTLYNGFFHNEESFRSSLSNMCNTRNPFYTRNKEGIPFQQLFFINVDSIFFFAACGYDIPDKLKEFFELKVRIKFSELYCAKRMIEDADFAANLFEHLENEKEILDNLTNNVKQESNTAEKRYSSVYDNLPSFRATLDLLDISREEFIQCNRLDDEIMRNGGAIIK